MPRSRDRDTSAALYEKVKVLLEELRKANTKITERRVTNNKFLDLLSKERNRNRLVEGYVSRLMERGASHARARKQALAYVWQPIVRQAFKSATTLATNGKCKLDPDDIKLPLRILHFSDMSSSSSSAVAENQVKIESSCKLTEKDVQLILKFCFDMLENDDVRKLAEMELMNTLIFLCERVDYVAFFHPEDVQDILGTAQDALMGDEDEVAVAGARLFGAVLESCVELGVGLFLVVSKSLEVVGKWCRYNLEHVTSNPREFRHLLRGVTALLRSHPEQAINPLTKFGRFILRYAKRSYNTAITANRHAIHGYLIAHVIVNQKAGALKGLLPGELGDLGRATIDVDQLNSILSAVISSLSKVEMNLTVKKRVTWKTLDATLRRHLECCARLLACAQRRFLVDEEWKLLDDPNDFFTRMTREFSRDKDDIIRHPPSSNYPSCPASVLTKSPWVKHILKPLLQLFQEIKANSHMGTETKSLVQRSQDPSREAILENNPDKSYHPLLEHLVESNGNMMDVDVKKSSLLLLVVSACAEAFPSGKCWGSSSHDDWLRLEEGDDPPVADLASVDGCSPTDLALLVHIIATLLEACGGSTGDPELQVLTLICLTRLTEVHRVLIAHTHDPDVSKLAASWRLVWSVLVRSDLQYAVSTAHAAGGSCGQLVLVLMTEIVQGWCTDPAVTFSRSVSVKQSTFLYRKQSQIWALPAFGKATKARTKHSFEIACAILHRVCLSDEGKDNIQDDAPPLVGGTSVGDEEGRRVTGRRYRLVCFCLQTLHSSTPAKPSGKQRELILAASTCLSALVNGSVVLLDRTFIQESQNLTWKRPFDEDMKCRLCLTELPGASNCVLSRPTNRMGALFQILWTTPIEDPGMSSLQRLRFDEAMYSDVTLAVKYKLRARLRSLDASSVHIDYVPTNVFNFLNGLLKGHIPNLLNRWTQVEEEEEDLELEGQLEGKIQPDRQCVLSPETLWLKVAMGVLLLGGDDKLSSGFDMLEDSAVTIFARINANLSTLCDSRDEFHAVFMDLLQLFRFLTKATSLSSVDIPAKMMKGIGSFTTVSESLLLSFSGKERTDGTLWGDDADEDAQNVSSDESDNNRVKTSTTDLLDDSDDDDIVNRRTVAKREAGGDKRKKKSSPPQDGSPQRKKKRYNPSPPDSNCACVVGSILVTLEPSVSRCEFAVECLLRKGEDKEVDLGLAYHCLNILCDETVIFHDNAENKLGDTGNAVDESFRHQSPISMFCEVLISLRESALASSSLHMFGFQMCEEAVRLGENEELRGRRLSGDESKQLVGQLTKDESIDLRPYLRADRLRSTTAAFVLGAHSDGDDNFLSNLEKYFPRRYISSSLKDLCPFVRLYSGRAVDAALRILSGKDAIFKAVTSQLPPVVLSSDSVEDHKGYQKWYQSIEVGRWDVDDDVFEDALMSMEASAIKCRAILAGACSDFKKDVLFELTCISANRPDLQAVCFHACEKVALSLGYTGAEDLLDDESEGILAKWLESGKTLGEVPLLLASPSLLRMFLKIGMLALVYAQKDGKTDTDDARPKTLDVPNMQDVAADEFLARHKAFILAKILVRLCSADQAQGANPKTLVMGDKSLQELCVCLKSSHDEMTLRTLVQGRFHDIEALCATLDNSESSALGRKLMGLVSGFLNPSHDSNSEVKKASKPHLTVRRILELSGKEARDLFPTTIIQEAFSEAVSTFVDKLKPSKNGDILSAAGTSLTECFLYARQWLEKATLVDDKEMRWTTVSLLFALIFMQLRRGDFKHTQLAFGVNVAVDVMLNPELSCIRGKALAILKQVLDEVIVRADESETLKMQFANACRRLVGSLMKTHEENQRNLLNFCKSKAKKNVEVFQSSVGLLGRHGTTTDTWGWGNNDATNRHRSDLLDTAVGEFHSIAPQFLIDSITGTYDLLVAIFDKANVLGLGQECFVGCAPPFSVLPADQEALAYADPRYCVQRAAMIFLKRDQAKADDLSEVVGSLLRELKNRSYWMESFSKTSERTTARPIPSFNDESLATLNMSQWMLNAELVQLEHKLHGQKLSGKVDLGDDVIAGLVEELSFVCGASCPQGLRSAASRCLGELDPLSLETSLASKSQPPKDWVQMAVEEDALVNRCQAYAIGVLVEYLHARQPEVAIAAVNTLIALLANSDGVNPLTLLDQKAQEDLAPVLPGKKRSTNLSRLTLSKLHIGYIKSKYGLAAKNAEANQQWCWEKRLWQCPSESTTYEDWICDLVPALILCCYQHATRSGVFFSACSQIAAIAPDFATALFPAIVIDLLERSGEQDTGKSPKSSNSAVQVAEDTWIGRSDATINKRLSSCFEVMLGQSQPGSTQDSKAVTLALDTIDLLRRTTQSRFFHSESHKRNSNALPNMSSKSGRTSKTLKSPKSATGNAEKDRRKEDYNEGLGKPTPWKGVPFGTVLTLNGDLVVKACLRTQRYASALFYSDLYFESCFGGSGAIMERLSCDFVGASAQARSWSKVDISGFYVGCKANEPSTVRERAVSSSKALRECYLQLREVDGFEAIERQSSDMRYGDCTSLVVDRGEVGRVLLPALDDLQRLDSMSNLTRHPVATSSQTADVLEALGLRTLLQSHISSMDWSRLSSISDDEERKLREKWFENRLYGMNWDTALSDDVTGDGAQVKLSTAFPTKAREDTELSREEMGFHEAITNALVAYVRDDLQSCQGLLDVARSSLLGPISSMATTESSSLQGLCMYVERLEYLNDIGRVVDGSESPDTLIARWGFSTASSEDGSATSSPRLSAPSFPSAEFTPHMQEVFLRFRRYKSRAEPAEALDAQRCLIEHLWSFCHWCRRMNFLPAAEASLQRLRSVLQVCRGQSPSLELVLGQRLEEASLRERRGDFATAIRLSKQAIAVLNEERTRRRKSDAQIESLLVDSMVRSGNWLSKHKIEPAQIILDSYHQPASLTAESLWRDNSSSENARRHLRAQIALASLASSLYDSTLSRVKSLEWIRAGRSLADREQEARTCDAMVKEVREKRKRVSKKGKEFVQLSHEENDLAYYGRQLLSEIRLAKTARSKTEKALRDNLRLAVQSFASALSISGVGHDTDMSRHVFRMVYLWLSTCSEGEGNVEINSVIDNAISRIPSFRFVPLTSQLFAQIDRKEGSEFQKTLHTLVNKMCRDHPYHCIVQLISVCNGKKVGGGVSGRNVENFLENMSESKVEAAAGIAAGLKKESTFVGPLVESYETLMSAYIALANVSTSSLVEQKRTKNIQISQVFPSSKTARLDRCLTRHNRFPPCVLTSPPPVRPGCDYGDGVEDPIGGERVGGFEPTFSITDSGLHRPKIVICQGTKGGRFRQLVKGEDEIRQDAVMEQVFTYVNELMRRQASDGEGTSSGQRGRSTVVSRELRMVTYNIIPLSPASGVLEWVEDSVTFGDYILDTKTSKGYNLGAHSRFYPGEWGHTRCRQHYAMSPHDLRRQTFDTICKFWSPSFRFFFVERFSHSLKDWYDAKMRYTKSVAVSSIVGHILGIGDRHTNNILVSEKTGEVVHIDFGIVFEQGKVLNIPEVVPFRLTRNIVDGMGPTGTEGTFARSAEATAAVLRENANALLTILSAIASDPLYRWSVSPVEARRRQRLTDDDDEQPAPKKGNRDQSLHTESKSDRNEAAALVLAKIQEKLQGYEDGTSGEQQGVEGQVQLLINSARDPANLSIMFQGWAPWV